VARTEEGESVPARLLMRCRKEREHDQQGDIMIIKWKEDGAESSQGGLAMVRCSQRRFRRL
jgi:hypothetical protein